MKYVHVVYTFALHHRIIFTFTSTCYVYIYIYSRIQCIALPYLTLKDIATQLTGPASLNVCEATPGAAAAPGHADASGEARGAHATYSHQLVRQGDKNDQMIGEIHDFAKVKSEISAFFAQLFWVEWRC